MALEELLKEDRFQVTALLTTLTRESDCISMHGVRRVLLERQAESLGFPLEQIVIPRHASNQEYEAALEQALAGYRERGVGSMVFGDLFLEDIRSYREALFNRLGMRPIFPLWKHDTSVLIKDFTARGFKAVVACVDSKSLDSSLQAASSIPTSLHGSHRVWTPAARTASSTRSSSMGRCSKRG